MQEFHLHRLQPLCDVGQQAHYLAMLQREEERRRRRRRLQRRRRSKIAMSRRLSSQTASETAGTVSQRRPGVATSRSSLGRPNSSPSPWYTSSGNGVSLASITITSPSRPLSVSGNLSDISYPTSVSSSIIPCTQTRLVSAASTAWPTHGIGGSAPRVCRALRAAEGTAVPSSSGGRVQPLPPTTIQPLARVVPSQGRLAHSRSSSCGAGHAFLRRPSRINVSRMAPRKSNPVIAEQMRIAESLKRHASAGRPCVKRALFLTATGTASGGRAADQAGTSAALDTTAGSAHVKVVNETPRILTSTEVKARVERRPDLTAPDVRSESSTDEVGKALFSDWTSRKKEMFADVFKDRKDFFADLIKQRAGEKLQPKIDAQRTGTQSAHSEMFMTTISETVEKDVADTSVDNYTMRSLTGPSVTASTKAAREKDSLQATAGFQDTASSDFDSYELSKTLESKSQAPEARTEEFLKGKIETAPESLPAGPAQPDSFISRVGEPETEPEIPIKEEGVTEPHREPSTELLVPYTESEDKREAQLELTSSAKHVEDNKPVEVLRAPAWSVETTSVRAEAPTETSACVPALAETTLESPGATSEDRQLVPGPFEGLARSMASEMTEFPVFDMSKTQEPDAATNLPSLRPADDGQFKTELTELPKTPEYTQPQYSEAFPKLNAETASYLTYPSDLPTHRDAEEPKAAVATEHTFSDFSKSEIGPHAFSEERSGQTLAVRELEEREVKNRDELLLKQEDHTGPSEVENLLLRKAEKEGDVRDAVERKGDEETTVADATATEEQEAPPLKEHAAPPREEERLAIQELGKETLHTEGRQHIKESESVSFTQALGSSATQVPRDVLLTQRTTAFAADAYLYTQEREKERETRDMLPRNEDKGSEFISERTEATDNDGTEKYESFQLTERSLLGAEEPKKLETLDIVLKQADQGFELAGPTHATNLTVAEKSDELPLTEQVGALDALEYIDTRQAVEQEVANQEPLNREQGGSLLSSKDTDALGAPAPEIHGVSLAGHSSASADDNAELMKELDDVREKREVTSWEPYQGMDFDSLSKENALEKDAQEENDTNLLASHTDQKGDLFPLKSPEAICLPLTNKTESLPLMEVAAFQQVGGYTLTSGTEKTGPPRDIVIRPPDLNSELEASKSPETPDIARSEKDEGGVFLQKIFGNAPALATLKKNRETTQTVLRPGQSSEVALFQDSEATDTVSAGNLEESLFPPEIIEYTLKPEVAKENVERDVKKREDEEGSEPFSSERPEMTNTARATHPEWTSDYTPFTAPYKHVNIPDVITRKPDLSSVAVSSEVPQPADEITTAKHQEALFSQQIIEHTSKTEERREIQVKDATGKPAEEINEACSSERPQTIKRSTAGKGQNIVDYTPIPELREEQRTDIIAIKPEQTTEIFHSEGLQKVEKITAAEFKDKLIPRQITERTKEPQGDDIIGRETEEPREPARLEHLTTVEKPHQTVDYTPTAEEREEGNVKVITAKPDISVEIIPSEGSEAADTITAAKLEKGLVPHEIARHTFTGELRKGSEAEGVTVRETEETREPVSLERPETSYAATAERTKEIVEYEATTEQREAGEIKEITARPDLSAGIAPSGGSEAADTVTAAKLEAGVIAQEITERRLTPERRKESEVEDRTGRETEEARAPVSLEHPETIYGATPERIQQIVEYETTTEQREAVEIKAITARAEISAGIAPSVGSEAADEATAAKLEAGVIAQEITELTLTPECRKQSKAEDTTARETEEAREPVTLEHPEMTYGATADWTQHIVEYEATTEQREAGEIKDITARPDISTGIAPSEGSVAADEVTAAKLEAGVIAQEITERTLTPKRRKETEVEDKTGRETEEARELVSLEHPEATYGATAEWTQQIVEYEATTEQREAGKKKDITARPDISTGIAPSEGSEAADEVTAAKLEAGVIEQEITERTLTPERRKETEVEDKTGRETEEARELVSLEHPEATYGATAEWTQQIVEYEATTEQREAGKKKDIIARPDISTGIAPSEGSEAADEVTAAKLEAGVIEQEITERTLTPERRKETEVEDKTGRETEEARELVSLEHPEATYGATAEWTQQIVEYEATTEQREAGKKKDITARTDISTGIAPSEGSEAADEVTAAKLEAGVIEQEITERTLTPERRKETEVEDKTGRETEEARELVSLEHPEATYGATAEWTQQIVEYEATTEQREAGKKKDITARTDISTGIAPSEGSEAADEVTAAKLEAGVIEQEITQRTLTPERRKETEVEDKTGRETEEARELVSLEHPEATYGATAEWTQQIVEYEATTEQREAGKIKDITARPDISTGIAPSEGSVAADEVTAAKLEAGVIAQEITERTLTPERRKETEVEDKTGRETEEARELVSLEHPEATYGATAEWTQQIVEYEATTEQREAGKIKDIIARPDISTGIAPSEGSEGVDAITAAKLEAGVIAQEIAERTLTPERRKESEVEDTTGREREEASEPVSLDHTETTYGATQERMQQVVEYETTTEQREAGEIKDITARPDLSIGIAPSEGSEGVDAITAAKLEAGVIAQEIAERTLTPERRKESEVEDTTGREREEASEPVSLDHTETTYGATQERMQQVVEYETTTEQREAGEIKDITARPDLSIGIAPSEGSEGVDAITAAKLEAGVIAQEIAERTLTPERRKESEVEDTTGRETEEARKPVSLERPETTYGATAERMQQIVEYEATTEQREAGEIREITARPDLSTGIAPSEGSEAADTVTAAKVEEGLIAREITERTLTPERRKESEVEDTTGRETEESREPVSLQHPETTYGVTAERMQQIVEYEATTEQREAGEIREITARPDLSTGIAPSEGSEAADTVTAAKLEAGVIAQEITERTLTPERRKESEVEDTTRRETEEAREPVSLQHPETTYRVTAERMQQIVEYEATTEQRKAGEVEEIISRPDLSTGIAPSEGSEGADAITAAKLEAGVIAQEITERALTPERRKESEVEDTAGRETEEAREPISLENAETTYGATAEKTQQIVEYGASTEQREAGETKDITARSDLSIGIAPSEGSEGADAITAAKLEAGVIAQEITERTLTPERIKGSEAEGAIVRETKETRKSVSSEQFETTHATKAGKPQRIVEYEPPVEHREEGETKEITARPDLSTWIVPSEGSEAADRITAAKLEVGLISQEIAEHTLAAERKKEGEIKEIIGRETEETREPISLKHPEVTYVPSLEKRQQVVEYESATEQRQEGEVKDITSRPDLSTTIVPSEGSESAGAITAAKFEDKQSTQQIAEYTPTAEEQKESEMKVRVVAEIEQESGLLSSEGAESSNTGSSWKLKESLSLHQILECSYTLKLHKEDARQGTGRRLSDETSELVHSESTDTTSATKVAKFEEDIFMQQIAEFSSSSIQQTSGEERGTVTKEPHERIHKLSSENLETADTTRTPKHEEDLLPRGNVQHKLPVEQDKEGDVKGMISEQPGKGSELDASEGREIDDTAKGVELEGLSAQKIPESASTAEQNIEGEVKQPFLRESHETTEPVPIEGPETADTTTASKPEEGLLPEQTADYMSLAQQQNVDERKHRELRERDQGVELVSLEARGTVDEAREAELGGLFPRNVADSFITEDKKLEGEVKEIVLIESHETTEVVASEGPETADTTRASKPEEGLFPEQTADNTSFAEQKVDERKDREARQLDQGVELVSLEGRETAAEAREAELEGGLFPRNVADSFITEEKKLEGEVKEIVLRESHETTEVVASEGPETADTTRASKPEEGLFPEQTADNTSFAEQKVDERKDREARQLDQGVELVSLEGRETAAEARKAELKGGLFQRKVADSFITEEKKLEGKVMEIVLRESHETTEVVASGGPETADTPRASKPEEGLFPDQIAEYPSFAEQKVDERKDREAMRLDQGFQLVSLEARETAAEAREAELEGGLFPRKVADSLLIEEKKLQGEVKEIVLRESHETTEVVASEGPETADTTKLSKTEGLFPEQTDDYTYFMERQKDVDSKDLLPKESDQSSDFVPLANLEAADAAKEGKFEGGLFLQQTARSVPIRDEERTLEVKEIIPKVLRETSEAISIEGHEVADTKTPIELEDGLFTQQISDYTSSTLRQNENEIKEVAPREPDQTNLLILSEGSKAADTARTTKFEEGTPVKVTGYPSLTEQERQTDVKMILPRQPDRSSDQVPLEIPETVDMSGGGKTEEDLLPQKIGGRASTKDEQKKCEVEESVPIEKEQSGELVFSGGAVMIYAVGAEKLEEGLPQEIKEYMFTTEQQKGVELKDAVPQEVNAVHLAIEHRAFAAAELPDSTAEGTTKAGAFSCNAPEQVPSILTNAYSTSEPGEAVLQVKLGLESGAAVDYAAQFWDSETIALQLTNTWTPEGGTVLSPEEMFSPCATGYSDDAEEWKSPPLCKDAEEKESRLGDSGTNELQEGKMWTPAGGPTIAGMATSGSAMALCDSAGIMKATKTPQDDGAVDYAAKFWDSESIELQLANMWTPEGGAVVVEDIPSDIIVPQGPAALLALQEDRLADQQEHDISPEKPAIDSLGSPEKLTVEENLLQPESSEVPKLPTTEIILEPGYLPRAFETEAFASPQGEPQKHERETVEERTENGPAEVSPDSQPAIRGKEKSELYPVYVGKEKSEATSGSVEAGSTTLGTLPEPVWISMPEQPEYAEREQYEAEDTTVTAEPVFKTEKQKSFQESEQFSSDFIGDRLDRQINDQRGPLLSITRTEKHSCEKTIEHILKRHGGVQPMESVTGAHENFVIAETETEFFDDTRESSTRNTTEKARTEDRCSPSRFEPDVSFVDSSGKNLIEETNASQPIYVDDLVTVDYIVRPLDTFDDIFKAVQETSTTGSLSQKQLPNDEMAICVQSNKTHQADSSYPDRETEESAKVSDDLNLPRELPKYGSPKLLNNFTSFETPSFPTLGDLPNAECTSLSKADNGAQRLTSSAANTSIQSLPGIKKSDISIRIERAYERSSSLTAKSDALVDEVLNALQKPSLRVSDCSFEQQSVAASVALVMTERGVLSALTLPDTGNNSPVGGESATSEPEWTLKTYSVYDTKESLKDLSVDAIASMPPIRFQTDINFVSLTDEYFKAPATTDKGEKATPSKTVSSHDDSVFQTGSAPCQEALPEVGSNVFTEMQAQSVQNQKCKPADCERVEASCPPNGKRQFFADVAEKPVGEQSRLPALAADDTSFSYVKDVHVLSDEQNKSLSADIALQAGFVPFKTGTPPVIKPSVEMSTLGTSTSKPPETVAYKQTWFGAEGPYPLTVQVEVPEEDCPNYPELPPRLSRSDIEQENRRFLYAAEIPLGAPIKEHKENGSTHCAIKQADSPFLVGPVDDRDTDSIRQGPSIDTEGGIGTSQREHVVLLSSAKFPEGSLNVAGGTADVGKKTIRKRKLSFSDQITVGGETFLEKREPLGDFCGTSTAEASRSHDSKHRFTSSNEAAGFPGRQEAHKNIDPLAIVISEEERFQNSCEEPAALERKESVQTAEAALKRHDATPKSETDDNLKNNQSTISAGADRAVQCEEFSTLRCSQNGPDNNIDAMSATWTAENKTDGSMLPECVDTLFGDTRFLVNQSKHSQSTESLGFSSEHAVNVCAKETMHSEHHEAVTALENETWESLAQEDASLFVPGTTCSSTDATAERKSSPSSVSVGYSHERQPSHNGSYSGNITDDLESLKALVRGTIARSQDSRSISDDKSRKNDLTTTLSSHSRRMDSPIFQQYTQSLDADTAYVPATVLRDDTFQASFPGPTLTDSGADASGECELPVLELRTCNNNVTTKQQSALSPEGKSASSIEEAATQGGATLEPILVEGARAEVVPAQCGASESSTSDRGGYQTLLFKAADASNKDDACDMSREVPDVYSEPSKAVAHCEELRFHNFRMVVERVADMSTGSDTNIVYETFVPAQGRATDTLGNVCYGSEFTVRTVDDCDLPGVMYDHWNEDATTVAPTIKSFWTYSPHSFLVCVNENGTRCGIISAIVFEDEQAFCAANSVKCEFVEEGVRRKLWDALLGVQQGKNLFAVVPAEQVNAYYRQLGFYSSARGLILHGKLAADTDIAPLAEAPLPDDVEIVRFNKHMYGSLLSFDKSTLGFGRKRFWKMTLREGPISFRVALRGSERRVCGYAGLQNDVRGVPVVRWLVADDGQVALRLLHNLLAGSVTFRQRGAWMAVYARSHASAALLRHLNTNGFQPWMLVFNRREPFLQYKNIAVLTYI